MPRHICPEAQAFVTCQIARNWGVIARRLSDARPVVAVDMPSGVDGDSASAAELWWYQRVVGFDRSDQIHAMKKACELVRVQKGWYPIKVDFFDEKAGARLRLLMGETQEEARLVPAKQLCCRAKSKKK